MPSVIKELDMSRQIDNNKIQFEYLELASRGLDRYVIADNSRPSFLEITGLSQRNSATCSGLNAGDYRNLAALLNHSNLSQLKVRNKVPLPPEIMEHFGHMQNHCLMGVFPEISRVWLTIDRNIYVWAFEHGTDVAYYDGLMETIVSVGLVKPKAGVFQNFVKYLLVLTTPVEIVVLGVTFTSNQGSEFEEMHLVPEPVFMLPTDSVSMMCVKSTANGRIFMGGKDGCLYEIVYQAQSGWFGEHCKKVNHSTSKLSFLVPSFLNAALYDEDPIVRIEIDNSRHILYTLSEKGCIELFDLGHEGVITTRITRLTQGKIVTLAMDIVKTLEPNNFKPVISISAVDLSESEYLNLVAVTQAGARLYFSTIRRDNTDNIVVDARPNNLNLVHVRLPPGFTPNASVLRPKQVHSAAYDNGTLLMVCSSGAADNEILWCMSRLLPGDATFTEAHSLMPLDGPVWALTSLPSPHVLRDSTALRAKKEVWSSTRWAVVSGSGAALIEAGSSPDILKSLLRDCRGPEAQPIKDFFQLQSAEQACACALYIACEDREPGDQAISEWAARAFFLHGSQVVPQMQASFVQSRVAESVMRSPAFSPRQMSTPMTMRGAPQGQIPKSSPQYQQMPLNHSQMGMTSPNQSFRGSFQNMMSPNQYNQSGQFNKSYNMIQQQMDPTLPMPDFTAKHNGLYMYVGRIISPIWFIKCVSKSLTPEKKEFLTSNLSGEECAYIVARLRRLSLFLQRASAAHNSDEYTSLIALKQFLVIVIEMLCLWKVLTEHQFHVIAGNLPQEQQNALSSACFRELFVNGQDVACVLLNSLVSGYLRDNASVDGISQKLRQLCPTLYKQEDATCSKANELLLFAKQQKNPTEKDEMLQQALKLCMDVAPNVNLPMVCSKLVSSGFYSGVVQLCVACARRIDPQDQALHYYKSDQPAQDREGHLVYYRRMEIYREVCVALERLYEDSIPKSSGAPKSPASRGNAPDVVITDDNCQGRKLISECLSSNDELLHVAVYEWLVHNRLGSELLALGAPPPPTLRAYLQAAASGATRQGAIPLLDLLWKVLQKCGDHLAAATVLEGLATRPGTGATLAQRMSWLSSGVVCVRGTTGSAGVGGGELARRLEEAGEVARVQLAVARALAALPRHLQPPPHITQRLQEELLEITQLYEEYADRYNLWECKLAIVQCSGHTDSMLVENIWSNILSEAEQAARSLTSPDELLGSVLSKITTLGKEYINTGHCFPLYFIIRHLETMNCKLQANHRLVYKAIMNIGVSLEQILDIYIKLVSMNERIWLASGDEIHLGRVCGYLLESVREDVIAMQPTARRRVLARCKDLHEAILCALQARPNTQTLVDKLATAQGLLDRLD